MQNLLSLQHLMNVPHARADGCVWADLMERGQNTDSPIPTLAGSLDCALPITPAEMQRDPRMPATMIVEPTGWLAHLSSFLQADFLRNHDILIDGSEGFRIDASSEPFYLRLWTSCGTICSPNEAPHSSGENTTGILTNGFDSAAHNLVYDVVGHDQAKPRDNQVCCVRCNTSHAGNNPVYAPVTRK